MRRELPNLDWLRVFAATATTQSFVLAADLLLVTPGAVSQRIKSLESFLGIELFRRHAKGVELTEAGRRYARRVLPALHQLTEATREIASVGTAQIVRLTVLPALAQIWLGPRLDAFHALHPHISVELWADATVVDLRTSHFDLALRYGNPPFPGCDHRDLFFDELVPVASPALIESSRIDAYGLPEGVPLIVDLYWAQDFEYWLSEGGITRPKELNTQTFSLYSMALDAAVRGRGYMIGHTSLIGDYLRRGELQLLSQRRVPARHQFHLLTKSAVPLSDAAAAFAGWLLKEAQAHAALDDASWPMRTDRSSQSGSPRSGGLASGK